MDYYSQYVTEDFYSYIRRKRDNHCHGNHVEMQALSEMYNRTIEVYQYSIGEYGYIIIKYNVILMIDGKGGGDDDDIYN